MLLALVFSFCLSLSDTIRLSHIPDSVSVCLTRDFPPDNIVTVSEKGDIFIVEYAVKAHKSFLFHFNKEGIFTGYIGKQGEAPEEYSYPIWDIKCTGETVFVFSGRKITMYDLNGRFLSSALLTRIPNIREKVLFSPKSIYIYGESWDYNYDKKLYIVKKCIFEYNRPELKFVGSFFTPPLSSEFFEAGLIRSGFCGDIDPDNKEIHLVARPLPRIFVIDTETKKLKRDLKLRIRGFKKVKLADTKKWRKEGIFNDSNKFMAALEEWANSISFIDGLFYIRNRKIWVLNYRDTSNELKIFYLVIIDKMGRVIRKIEVPGRLLTVDKDNKLYFALKDNSIVIGTLKDN